MKYVKVFLLLLLMWPKFWYGRRAWKVEKKWREKGEIPPQYSEETKKFIKKQKRDKRWALVLSIFPLGPISFFVTWLALRPEKKKSIEYYVSQQIPELEELKEIRRRRQETLIKYLEEKFKLEDINWEDVMLPGSEEEIRLREFLFGENGVLVKGPEKDKINENENETEDLSI